MVHNNEYTVVIFHNKEIKSRQSRRRSQGFSKGGGVTLCQSEGTHQILMSTSTPCFSLKKVKKWAF